MLTLTYLDDGLEVRLGSTVKADFWLWLLPKEIWLKVCLRFRLIGLNSPNLLIVLIVFVLSTICAIELIHRILQSESLCVNLDWRWIKLRKLFLDRVELHREASDREFLLLSIIINIKEI